jgi:hypothetical protein
VRKTLVSKYYTAPTGRCKATDSMRGLATFLGTGGRLRVVVGNESGLGPVFRPSAPYAKGRLHIRLYQKNSPVLVPPGQAVTMCVLMANWTNSALDLTPSSSIMAYLWKATVRGVILRSRAVSFIVYPSARS